MHETLHVSNVTGYKETGYGKSKRGGPLRSEASIRVPCLRPIAILVGAMLLLAPIVANAQSDDDYDLSPYMDSVTPAIPDQLAWYQLVPYDSNFANDQAMGIRWAYVTVTWSDIEQVAGQYEWQALDNIVESAHSHGIYLMMQVQTSGDWVEPGPAQLLATGGYRTNSLHPFPPSAAPINMQGVVPFWKAVAARYMPGGKLAESQGWPGGYGVRYFEVENEPDSAAWTTGSWTNVPKDYALYVSIVKAALKSVSPSLKLVAPAIFTGPDGSSCCNGLTWLDQVLSTEIDLQWASDEYRAAVAHGSQPIIGGGPYIDAYSFHDDFYDASSSFSVSRVQAVRSEVVRFASQATYPTTSKPMLWMTEGLPLTTLPPDNTADASEMVQVAARFLANGVQRFNFSPLPPGPFPTEGLEQIATDPRFLAAKAMTTYFPSNQGVTDESASLTASAGQPVEGYKWINPSTGLASNILWAPDEPSGSKASGPEFTVWVPVQASQALVIGSDWSQTVVAATGGAVAVTVHRADPSGTVMVVEENPGGP